MEDKLGKKTREAAQNLANTETNSRIIAAINSLKYGSVEVIVHDGKVVEIDRKERIRVDPPK